MTEKKKIWNTGYGRGRPRIGEVRPPSPNAISAAKYRDGNEAWKEYNREKQAEWRANNLERHREISRESGRRRRAARKALGINT